MIYRLSMQSPVGALTLHEEERSITRLHFDDEGGRDCTPLLIEAARQLCAYFAGELAEFSLPLAPNGTEFQRAVWAELIKIPYGQTTSYREIAERLGRPNACRAVGGANGKNPIPIIIPCHRVINVDGGIGGYSLGLDTKRFLLELEQM